MIDIAYKNWYVVYNISRSLAVQVLGYALAHIREHCNIDGFVKMPLQASIFTHGKIYQEGDVENEENHKQTYRRI